MRTISLEWLPFIYILRPNHAHSFYLKSYHGSTDETKQMKRDQFHITQFNRPVETKVAEKHTLDVHLTRNHMESNRSRSATNFSTLSKCRIEEHSNVYF